VPDPVFANPRLALIYDTFDGDRRDLDPYLAIVRELNASNVLDVGCGTGCLATKLADEGITVVGVDPAEASLIVAQAKPGANRVRWIHGAAADLPQLHADLAVMTGNVAQVFLTDEDWAATLHGIRRALRNGGHLVFETRRPDARAWEEWATHTEPVIRHVRGIGHVTQWQAVTKIDLPLVSFRHDYRFPDGVEISSDSTLRFRSRTELETSLTDHGYQIVDLRDAPDRPGLEYFFITRAT
jgi:2-polyprenyl-3-methyl-5-hydroxy-6-metoxy-1,4-benzoquinol methylase